MEYTTIDDVKNKFNELYSWDQKKLINEIGTEYFGLGELTYDDFISNLHVLTHEQLIDLKEAVINEIIRR